MRKKLDALENFPQKYDATFTRDRTGTVPYRSGPDRFLFTWDITDTGPQRIQNWYFAGPVLDPFWTGSRTVPCETEGVKAYLVRLSDRIHLADPFGIGPSKHSLRDQTHWANFCLFCEKNLSLIPRNKCARWFLPPRGFGPVRHPRSPRVYTYKGKEYLLKK